MAEQRIFTLSQVAQHKSNKDCWLVIGGRVLDVTKFLEEHPGGEEVLMELGGKDATEEFDEVGHSKGAQNKVPKYQVGVLQGANIEEAVVDSKDDDDVAYKEPRIKEMSASFIKEEPVSKFVAFFEFFVPCLFATLYFGYRLIDA